MINYIKNKATLNKFLHNSDVVRTNLKRIVEKY